MQLQQEELPFARRSTGAALRWVMCFCVLLFLPTGVFAQPDTSLTLSKAEFLQIVRSYHPVARSANLQVARAQAGIRQARGAFDPVIEAGFDSKTLDGKNYYQYFNPQITIPTWYGLELIGGTEDVRGERVTTEATLGSLSYAGAKLNLSGIVLDSRRAALQQAKALATQSEAERSLAVNNLIYNAWKAYVDWQRERMLLEIIEDARANASERLRFVRLEYVGGLRPALDTVEALAQLQQLDLQLNAAQLAYTNAGLELSNYLWTKETRPFYLNGSVKPEPLYMPQDSLPTLDQLLVTAAGHPKLSSLRAKQEAQVIERRLKATYMMPKLSVKGTMLSKGYGIATDINSSYLENNSKVAAELRMPLFLREARGAYRAATFKVQETVLETDATELSIQNKLKSAYNEVYSLSEQHGKAEQALSNYQRLYAGERVRFEGGESTLFVLNSRQGKVIEGAQKLAELRAKRQKAEAELFYAAGMLK